MSYWNATLVALLIAICFLTNSIFAYAQTASQITPPALASAPKQRLGETFPLPHPPEATAPAGADKLFVSLGGVIIEGRFDALKEANEALIRDLTGRRISAAEIFEAARSLEAAYVKAGFVLVRVTVLPQSLNDGETVKIRVVDGYIERIDITNLPERIRGRVASILAPLIGEHPVKLTEIERRLLLAGDTPGTILRSTLQPGSETGAAILVIDASQQPVITVVNADNTLASGLGRVQVGIGGDFNSAFGFGETIYIRASGNPNLDSNGFLNGDPRNRLLGLGFIIPIGLDGLTFNLEGTETRTNPIATNGIASSDVFQRLSLRLRYPWLRSRDLDFTTEIGFDAQEERLGEYLAGTNTPTAEDRLRILRMSGDFDCLTSWGGTLTAHAGASFGLNVIGARTAQDATPSLPLSRQGTDAIFSKLEANASYTQALLDHLAISLSMRAQTSFHHALARSEQIGLAMPQGLSSFNLGTFEGDSGIVGRGEISMPFSLPASLGKTSIQLSPYLFGAVGEIFLQAPTALEKSRITAGSYGLGMRLNGGEAGSLSNGSLTFEYGRQLRDDGVEIGNRFIASASIRF